MVDEFHAPRRQVHAVPDNQERRIVSCWSSWISTTEARQRIQATASAQAHFVKQYVSQEAKGETVRNAYLALLEKLWIDCIAIKTGYPKRDYVSDNSGIIIASPHLGFSKLMTSDFLKEAGDFGDVIIMAVPNAEPWIWRHIAAYSVSRSLGRVNSFVPVEMMYDAPISFLQKQYGAALIQSRIEGNVTFLARTLRDGRFGPSPVLSMFPEGGTTGKRILRPSCYMLEQFRSGFVFLARNLGWPIVPVVHIVDSAGSSHLKILEPVTVSSSIALARIARMIHDRLQAEMTIYSQRVYLSKS